MLRDEFELSLAHATRNVGPDDRSFLDQPAEMASVALKHAAIIELHLPLLGSGMRLSEPLLALASRLVLAQAERCRLGIRRQRHRRDLEELAVREDIELISVAFLFPNGTGNKPDGDRAH